MARQCIPCPAPGCAVAWQCGLCLLSRTCPGTRADPRLVPCRHCDGTGLVATPAGHDSKRTKHQHAAKTQKPTLASCCDGAGATDFPVAIIGAGIGGCGLALALQQRGIKVVMFEKDKSFDERSQGYGLTMQQGATALMARQPSNSYIAPVFQKKIQNGLQAKSGFEMCFDIGSRHLRCWGQNTSPYAQGCDLS